LPNETKATGDKAAEQIRLDESREKGVPWKQWGPWVPASTDGLANPSRSFLHSRVLASGTNILYTFSHAVMPRLYRRRTEFVGRFPRPDSASGSG